MCVSLLHLCFHQDQSVSRPTGQSVLSTSQPKAASSLFWGQLNSSRTNFSKMKTIKGFKRQYSNGFSIKIKMPSLKNSWMKRLKSQNTIMCPTSQHSQIDSGHAFKNRMRCQKTSQLCFVTTFLNLTLIWFPRASICLKLSKSSTNH